MCFNRFGIRTTGTACAVTIQICPLIRSSRRCTSTSGGRDFPCSTNPKDVEAQVGLIWRLTYYVAHLSRDLPSLTIARWCDMEDKIALIAPGGSLHGGVSGAGITQTSVPFRSVSHRVVSTRSCTGLGASRRHRAVAGGVSSAWVCSSGSISSRITTWKIETDALRGMLGKAFRW